MILISTIITHDHVPTEKKTLTLKKHIYMYVNEHTHIYLVSSYLFLLMQYIVVEPYYVLYKKCYNSAFKLTNTDAVKERGVSPSDSIASL